MPGRSARDPATGQELDEYRRKRDFSRTAGWAGQVAFTEWTGAGQLRHPRYLGLRRDKDPASVTREVSRP